MMRKRLVPIEHKEYYERKRHVHYKEYPTAGTVFCKLESHILARSVFLYVVCKEESHNGKAEVVNAE